MAIIKFTSSLKRFFPELRPVEIQAHSVKEAIDAIEQEYNGLTAYLLEDDGRLREHVNLYIGEQLIQDRQGLTDTLSDQDELYIMQAISGG